MLSFLFARTDKLNQRRGTTTTRNLAGSKDRRLFVTPNMDFQRSKRGILTERSTDFMTTLLLLYLMFTTLQAAVLYEKCGITLETFIVMAVLRRSLPIMAMGTSLRRCGTNTAK